MNFQIQIEIALLKYMLEIIKVRLSKQENLEAYKIELGIKLLTMDKSLYVDVDNSKQLEEERIKLGIEFSNMLRLKSEIIESNLFDIPGYCCFIMPTSNNSKTDVKEKNEKVKWMSNKHRCFF
jgi:hypothetical protein